MKIVIADDHCMTRDILRTVATRNFGHEVVGEARDGVQALEMVVRVKPELLLVDLRLPVLDGFGVIAGVMRSPQRPRILVISAYCDPYTVYCVEKIQVDGFLDKQGATLAELRAALVAVSEGHCYFSQAFRRIAADRRANPRAFDKVLSEREQTILSLIGDLLTDRQIAERLRLSPHTAEKHRFNILRKLGLRTKFLLARYAFENGFRGFLAVHPQEPASAPVRIPAHSF